MPFNWQIFTEVSEELAASIFDVFREKCYKRRVWKCTRRIEFPGALGLLLPALGSS